MEEPALAGRPGFSLKAVEKEILVLRNSVNERHRDAEMDGVL